MKIYLMWIFLFWTANEVVHTEEYSQIFLGINKIYLLNNECISISKCSKYTKEYKFPSVLHFNGECAKDKIQDMQQLDRSLYLFFSAEKDIVEYLVSFKNDTTSKHFGLARWFKSFSKRHTSNRNFAREHQYERMLKTKKYVSLILLINYSINKIEKKNDIQLLFYNDFLGNTLEENDYLDQMFDKFSNIYDRFYNADIDQFHSKVNATFHQYINMINQKSNDLLKILNPK